MQRWEYMSFVRTREFDISPMGGHARSRDWNPHDLEAALNRFGAEGWELVGVSTRSDIGSESYSALAGTTTSEVFLFKRPRD